MSLLLRVRSTEWLVIDGISTVLKTFRFRGIASISGVGFRTLIEKMTRGGALEVLIELSRSYYGLLTSHGLKSIIYIIVL